MATIEIPVIKVHQNIGELYVGVMKARDLFEIASVDRIRLESLKVPKYAGFQRALVPERVDSIRDYLREARATFPNAIIISLDSEYVDAWEDVKLTNNNHAYPDVSVLKIQRENGAATIIDGQHRAAALNTAREEFMVIVSIFVDLELARKAQIFSKINSTQKAVNPSIAFQLFGYAGDRSPQKTAHDIAETLNTTEGSPFHRRLRMLGTKDDWSVGTLSQSTFCKELMRLYSRKPEQDENMLLLREKLETYPNYPLRNLFIDGKDEQILSIVWRFFYSVADTWPDQWSSQAKESILVKTTGYAALIAVLKQWLLSARRDEILNDGRLREALVEIREKHTTENLKFVRKNYPAGNQGVKILRESLIHDLHLE